ncbi:MAG: GGDEF domain-containing protein [Lachnospiraceae bacterium]|nr:GGDEF domain-containing protein [Lachnospiraceae bacterium]
MEKFNRKYHVMYAFMLAVFICMVAWMCIQYKGPSFKEESFTEASDFLKGWRTEDEREADIAHLNKLAGVETNKEFSIYNTLPDELEEGASLYYRSKNIFYKVYIDGKLVYEPYEPQNLFYTKSFGTRWNCIPILSQDAGKLIEIRITLAYSDARAGMDNLYIGLPGGIIFDILGGKVIAFVSCILLLFSGMLLIVADIPINMSNQKNHELMYLGLFAVSIAIWCITETNLLQFFVGDSRMLQVISCYSLILIPIPMILYLNSAYGFRKRFVVKAFVALSFLEFILCMVLHLLNVADLHETLPLSHIMLALSAIIMFYMIIRNSFIKGKNQARNIYRVLRGIGLCGISVATVIDIIRFYRGNSNDSAMFVRIGLLIFIICYGSSSLEKTINAVKLGVQAEFVSQLAYRDGLTGIGNRTAFQEHLVDLEKRKNEIPAVAIIMFDVNDLKFVNDNLGHHLGDSMLVQSANTIKSAFESQKGECFRIGGDEFAVLISGSNVQMRCEQGLMNFKKKMVEHNRKPDKLFRISIAYGYALSDKENAGKKLMDIYQQADMRMYENKKIMKASQSKPEEYYGETLLEKRA